MELSKLLEDLQKQQEEQYEIWEELESMAEWLPYSREEWQISLA